MKNEKSITMIEIVCLILFVCSVLVYLSGIIFLVKGEEIIAISLLVMGSISVLLYIILGYKYSKGFFNGRYSQKSRRVWKNIKKSAQNKVSLYLRNNQNNMEVSVILLLMEIYNENDKIFSGLLNEVISLYKSGDYYTKSVLSLVLLKNKDHNEVAELFKNNLELEKECKDISEENVKSIQDDFTYLQKEVNDRKLVMFFQKLSHICLPQNSISEEELVDLLNVIPPWVIQNISKENIDSYQESMSIFILLIPVIRNRLNRYNDDDIEKSFDQIEHSEWFKYLIDKAYKYVDFSLCSNETFLIKNQQWISYLCITSMYYEKLFFWQKLKLLFKINNKQQKLYKEYDVEKVVLFILCSSSIREVKSSDDLVYNGLSLIYLCISPLINGL